MILGPISLIDCLLFVIFLAPQLLIQAGLLRTSISIAQILPFLGIQLPSSLIRDRVWRKFNQRPPFVQHASIFEDIVVRCTRYAFANFPVSICRVFFSKWVAYPFFRFRMLRHGYLTSPAHVDEIDKNGVKGLWIAYERLEKPDLVIYYCHGGGFSMGSTYFYLEFLLAWLELLKRKGFRHPAIFALEYSLVPDETWPKQIEETSAGYRFLCDFVGDSTRICVSGDSAGATLILSRLLHPGKIGGAPAIYDLKKPGLALLLSPWTHLVSEYNRDTTSDYLNAESLYLYARQYANGHSLEEGEMSPGMADKGWKLASPSKGYAILYGSEEVFAPGIEATIRNIKSDGGYVTSYKENAGIHAWPVVNLFLGNSREKRLRGLIQMADIVGDRMMKKSENPATEQTPRSTAGEYVGYYLSPTKELVADGSHGLQLYAEDMPDTSSSS